LSSKVPDFLVHDDRDAVGVVVVEGVAAGGNLSGWVMDSDETISLAVNDPIPLGHKFALRDIRDGESVIKYGEDIGRAVTDIPKGDHVHVHNVKTSKW
jgi:(2R)-sulfolactate sulfo-lyase subunit alpha|tara:strand:+ start:984 stop:1277 length:294 start_codon:yes stop_codon:yes gene_type:complete